MKGKLVQLSFDCFEGHMNKFGMGLIISNPHSRRRTLPRLAFNIGRVSPDGFRSTNDWVRVLWNDGKIYEEYVDYLIPVP